MRSKMLRSEKNDSHGRGRDFLKKATERQWKKHLKNLNKRRENTFERRRLVATFPQCFWRLSIQTTMAPKEFEPPVHTIPVDSWVLRYLSFIRDVRVLPSRASLFAFREWERVPKIILSEKRRTTFGHLFCCPLKTNFVTPICARVGIASIRTRTFHFNAVKRWTKRFYSLLSIFDVKFTLGIDGNIASFSITRSTKDNKKGDQTSFASFPTKLF